MLWLVLLFVAIWLWWFMRRRGRAVVPVVTPTAWPERATDATVTEAIPVEAQLLVRRLGEALAPAAPPAREPQRTPAPKAARRVHGTILPPADATHALVPAAPAMRAMPPLAARPPLPALAARPALKFRQPLAPRAAHPSHEPHPSHASR